MQNWERSLRWGAAVLLSFCSLQASAVEAANYKCEVLQDDYLYKASFDAVGGLLTNGKDEYISHSDTFTVTKSPPKYTGWMSVGGKYDLTGLPVSRTLSIGFSGYESNAKCQKKFDEDIYSAEKCSLTRIGPGAFSVSASGSAGTFSRAIVIARLPLDIVSLKRYEGEIAGLSSSEIKAIYEAKEIKLMLNGKAVLVGKAKNDVEFSPRAVRQTTNYFTSTPVKIVDGKSFPEGCRKNFEIPARNRGGIELLESVAKGELFGVISDSPDGNPFAPATTLSLFNDGKGWVRSAKSTFGGTWRADGPKIVFTYAPAYKMPDGSAPPPVILTNYRLSVELPDTYKLDGVYENLNYSDSVVFGSNGLCDFADYLFLTKYIKFDGKSGGYYLMNADRKPVEVDKRCSAIFQQNVKNSYGRWDETGQSSVQLHVAGQRYIFKLMRAKIAM